MSVIFSIWRMCQKGRHRRSVRFIKTPPKIKMPLLPQWEQGQIKSAVPPCLPGRPDHSPRCQHTGCPITQATRQKILGENPFPSALGGPFAAPLFALLSAVQNSLWMRLQFDFRLKGLVFFLFSLLNYSFVFLSRTFFRHGWIICKRPVKLPSYLHRTGAAAPPQRWMTNAVANRESPVA